MTPLPGDARGELSAVTIGGLIYAMGGTNSYILPTYDYNHIYDPQTNTWFAGASLPAPRSHHGAAVIDGKIYLVGGEYRYAHGGETHVGVVDVYDPATDSWTTAAPVNVPRSELAVVTMHGRIYAIGGFDRQGGQYSQFRVVEEYDPRDDYWRTVTALPAPRAAASAAVLNGEIFVFGGHAGAGGVTSVYSGIPRPVHGDMNNDGVVDFFDIDPFLFVLFNLL
jgi:N-acetylneuraminic acid mutarotase